MEMCSLFISEALYVCFYRMMFMLYLLSLSVGLDGKILVLDHFCVFLTHCVALLDCIHFLL
jgi:hypothetical protein